MTSDVIDTESMTRDPFSVCDREDLSEVSFLVERERPLVQRSVVVFGDHVEDGSGDRRERGSLGSGERAEIQIGDRRVEHQVRTHTPCITQWESRRDPGTEVHLWLSETTRTSLI